MKRATLAFAALAVTCAWPAFAFPTFTPTPTPKASTPTRTPTPSPVFVLPTPTPWVLPSPVPPAPTSTPAPAPLPTSTPAVPPTATVPPAPTAAPSASPWVHLSTGWQSTALTVRNAPPGAYVIVTYARPDGGVNTSKQYVGSTSPWGTLLFTAEPSGTTCTVDLYDALGARVASIAGGTVP